MNSKQLRDHVHSVINFDTLSEQAMQSAFGPGETYPGYCISCGEFHEGIEPDAVGYECHACHKDAVYGAENILLMFA